MHEVERGDRLDTNTVLLAVSGHLALLAPFSSTLQPLIVETRGPVRLR